MLKIFKSIVIVSLSLSIGKADSNQSTQNELLYIDKLHKSISETVVEWSDIIDTTLSHWLEDNETNTTKVDDNRTIIETNITDIEDNETIFERNLTDREKNTTIFERNITDREKNITIHESNLTDIEGNSTIVERNLRDEEDNRTILERTKTSVKANTNTLSTQTRYVHRDTTTVISNDASNESNISETTFEEEVDTVDLFFQNDKYLDKTNETFIRIRSENYFESKGSNDFGMNVKVQMPLSKTKKRFKIFVDDLTLENANEILKDTPDTPDIGIHYFASRHKILSRYSIGFSGLDPFVKSRFNMPIEIDHWLIDPIQTFRYSTDNKFEEETNIYFDRKIDHSSFFRILLHRKTQDEIEGMDYALSAQYFRTGKKDTGFGLAQSFYGNTEYAYSTEPGIPHPKLKKYGGIHDYVTSFSWRANIWRKWFYYEVRPSVSFHRQYDYEANYRLRFFFDFYFGHHHKN